MKDFFYSNVGSGLVDGNIDYGIKRFSVYDGVQQTPSVQMKTSLSQLEMFCQQHNTTWRKLAASETGCVVLVGSLGQRVVAAIVAQVGKGGQNARRPEDFYLEGCVALAEESRFAGDSKGVAWELVVASDEAQPLLPRFTCFSGAALSKWLAWLADGQMQQAQMLTLLESVPIARERSVAAPETALHHGSRMIRRMGYVLLVLSLLLLAISYHLWIRLNECERKIENLPINRMPLK